LVSLGLDLGKNAFISRAAYIDRGFPWLIKIGDEATLARGVIVLPHDASIQAKVDEHGSPQR
jgi:hypothetical protein